MLDSTELMALFVYAVSAWSDVVTTNGAIRRGCVEANPIAKLLIGRHPSPVAVYGFGLLGCLAMVIVAFKIDGYTWIIWAGAFVHFLAAANNNYCGRRNNH